MAADEDRRPELEQFSRQSLHAEIAIGITYAHLAMTAYNDGHVLHPSPSRTRESSGDAHPLDAHSEPKCNAPCPE